MSRKLFVVSDIHGHFTELTDALEGVGFDANNEDHVFVSCGDLFDRGEENLRVYDFVRGLRQKILIKGNHEDMLCAVLRQGVLTQTEKDNGMDITVKQLLGERAVDADGRIDVTEHAERIGEITDFIDSMLDYYETERFVFIHGWLPIEFDGWRPHVGEFWRDATREEWVDAHELEWQQLYNVGAVLDGKTIVCGHRPSSMGYMFDSLRDVDCSEPFYGKGMIAIDAWTVRSGRVNVLVVEDHEP